MKIQSVNNYQYQRKNNTKFCSVSNLNKPIEKFSLRKEVEEKLLTFKMPEVSIKMIVEEAKNLKKENKIFKHYVPKKIELPQNSYVKKNKYKK